MRSVVRIKFGSHLYGTNTPQSDEDYKAVHIPSASEILLQRVRGSVCSKRDKREGEKNFVGEVDEESYSLQRYLGLLVEGQTVAIDMLFAPVPLHSSDVWEYIRANKHRLLTNKSAAFVGYCRTQANKYGIKGSRVAAARDAAVLFKDALDRLGHQAKVSEIADQLSVLAGEHTQIVTQVVNRDGDLGTFLECCNRKAAFTGTIKQAYEMFAKVYESYGNRAQLAQQNEGIDWKALSHAVRVGEEALELMSTGQITFPLRNASAILAIKQGQIPYESVADQIEKLLEAVENASATSVLRPQADLEFIDELVTKEYKLEVEGTTNLKSNG
jgi:hypothetical protein